MTPLRPRAKRCGLHGPAVVDTLDHGAADREVAEHLADMARSQAALRPNPCDDASFAALRRVTNAITTMRRRLTVALARTLRRRPCRLAQPGGASRTRRS